MKLILTRGNTTLTIEDERSDGFVDLANGFVDLAKELVVVIMADVEPNDVHAIRCTCADPPHNPKMGPQHAPGCGRWSSVSE